MEPSVLWAADIWGFQVATFEKQLFYFIFFQVYFGGLFFYALAHSLQLIISLNQLCILFKLTLALYWVHIAEQDISKPFATARFFFENFHGFFISSVTVPTMADVFIWRYITQRKTGNLVNAEAWETNRYQAAIDSQRTRGPAIEKLILIRHLRWCNIKHNATY